MMDNPIVGAPLNDMGPIVAVRSDGGRSELLPVLNASGVEAVQGVSATPISPKSDGIANLVSPSLASSTPTMG